MSTCRTPRIAAGLATIALFAGVAGCSETRSSDQPAAQESAPATDPGPSLAAAQWLGGELTEGLLYNADADFDDYGLSIDAALALEAIGGQDATVEEIADAVAAKVDSYTTGVDFGSKDVYAGATAKTTVLALSEGRDPADFGGVDLVERLEGLVATKGPIAGRVEDQTSTDDFANVLSQAYAARALTEVGADEAGAALEFLLRQQCEAGFFRLDLTVDKSTPDQDCDDDAPAPPPVDTTAVVSVLLEPLAAEQPDVKTALERATAWMLEQQGEDGSFPGGTETEAANANSTGLAGWALGELGEGTAAGEAAAWVEGLQVVDPGDDCEASLGEHTGAIAYDASAEELGCRMGITDATSDQWRRATAQGAPALVWLPSSS